MFKRKRIISFVLAVCMSVVFFVSCSIIAFAEDTGEVGKSFVKLKYVLTQLGCLFGGDLDEMISNSEKFQQFEDGNIPTVDDGKGSVTIDNSTVNNIYNVAKEEVTKLNGYYLIEPKHSIAEFLFAVTDGIPASRLEDWRKYFKGYTPEGLLLSERYGTTYVRIPYRPSIGVYLSKGYVCGYSERYGEVQFGGTSYYNSYQYWFDVSSADKYKSDMDYFVDNLVCDSPVKLFYTLEDLRYYKSFGGRVYLTNNFNNYSNSYDHSITYKNNVINNTDWSQVNNNIYNNIYNNYQGTPEDQRQDLIDLKYDEILSALGDIGGNVEDVNKTLSNWLSRIYTKVDSILTIMQNPTTFIQSILDKISDITKKLGELGVSLVSIFDFLSNNVGDNFNKLVDRFDTLLKNLETGTADIVQAIKDIKIDGSGSGVGSGVGSTIGTLIGNLLTEWIKDLLDNALDTGGDLVDTANSILDNLGTMFSPVADVAKTKFPFSLPWDIYACIKILAAEPETPVFKFDLSLPSYGINEQLIIDLKDFETLSKLSRAFFTLTFVVILVNFTLKITQREDM